MRWLIVDWGQSKRHIFEPMIMSMRSLGHDCVAVTRGGAENDERVAGAIRSGSFDAMLTWQRFYPAQESIIEALRDAELHTVYMDFGFLPHYESVAFDVAGENAASAMARRWSSREFAREPVNPVELRATKRLVETHAPRWSFDEQSGDAVLPALYTPFVFVPLQRPRDSVILYDGSVHDFGSFVRRILFLARGTLYVVVKTHPLDNDIDLGLDDYVANSHMVIRTGTGGDNERINETCLRGASLVVGVNSNMLFRALLHNRPVISAGRSWFSGSGAYTEVDGLDGLVSLAGVSPPSRLRWRVVHEAIRSQLLTGELSDRKAVERMLAKLEHDARAHRSVEAGVR